MEHIWLNPKHTQDAEKLSAVEDSSLEHLTGHTHAPTKEALDDTTKEYIEARFPVTNDDTLQEDLAQKFVFDDTYLERLHDMEAKGTKEKEYIAHAIWNMYSAMMEMGAYIDVFTDMNKHISELIDNVDRLNTQIEIREEFPLAKSGMTNKEALALAKSEAEDIKRALYEIQDSQITKESVGALLDMYKALYAHYAAINNAISTDHPERN